jgi:dsDNA-specific endonuclease/ATPase MutS2
LNAAPAALLEPMSLIDWLHRLFSVPEGKTPYASDEDTRDPDDNVDPYNPFPELVEIEIKDVIDLHTIPPRDVARVVEEYLHQTHDAGFPVVRIIHGKGIGVQRTLVHSILAKTPFVIDWTDAPPEAGGLGATIVRLKTSSF